MSTKKNVLNALGALYILNRYVLSIIVKNKDQIDIFSNDRCLFILSELKSKYMTTGNLILKEIDDSKIR